MNKKSFKKILIFTLITAILATVAVLLTYKTTVFSGKIGGEVYYSTSTSKVTLGNTGESFYIDSALGQCLNDIPQIADGGWGGVNSAELLKLTGEVDCSNKGITNLQEIGTLFKYLPNIESLNLSGNQFTTTSSLTLTSDLKALKQFTLQNTNIAYLTIDSTVKSNLETINLENASDLLSFDLSGATSLKRLLLSNSKVGTLNLSDSLSLESVQLWSNSRLSSVTFNTDEEYKNLTLAHLDNNGLTSLNLSKAKWLKIAGVRIGGNAFSTNHSMNSGEKNTYAVDIEFPFSCSRKYISSDEIVAKIVETNKVLGVSKGNTTITETLSCNDGTDTKDYSFTRIVTVNNTPTNSISATSEVEVVKGTTKEIIATIVPANTTDNISVDIVEDWVSSEGYATVNKGTLDTTTGELPITIKANNVTSNPFTIKISAGSETKEIEALVVAAKASGFDSIMSMGIEPTNVVLDSNNQTVTIVPYFVVVDGSKKYIEPGTVAWSKLKWEFSNSSVAHYSTSDNGKIRADEVGKTRLTVKYGNLSAECEIEVKSMSDTTITVTEVSLDKSTLSLAPGGEATLIATVTPSNATDKTVTWSSSKTSVATVDTNGKVTVKSTAKAGDAATITAKVGDETATCTVTVISNSITPTKITISSYTGSYSVGVGNHVLLQAKLEPDGATGTVTWSSSDSETASVNEATGKVSGHKAGKVTITAKVGNLTESVEILVTTPATGIEISDTIKYVRVDKTLQLKANVLPSTATNQTVSWDSSDPTVAKVDSSGLVTGMKSGTAVITAKTSNNKSDTVTISVVRDINIKLGQGGSIKSISGKTTGSGTTNITAVAGKQITITAAPASGLSLPSIKLTADGKETTVNCESNVCSFTMPDAAVTIDVNFVRNNYEIINDYNEEGGTTTLSQPGGKIGDEITLTNTPNDEYKVESVTVEGVSVECNDSKITCTFEMPARDVTVKVKYVKKTYDIKLNKASHITTTVASEAEAGKEVEIKNTPDDGYMVSSLVVTATTGETITATCDKQKIICKFKMPSSGVKITLTYSVGDITPGDYKYDIDRGYLILERPHTIAKAYSPITDWPEGYIYDESDKDSTYLGTGEIILVSYNGNLIAEYTIIAKGDITGDGKVNVYDVAMLFQHLRGTKTITDDLTLLAGDVAGGDNQIRINDVGKIYQFIKDKIESLER